MQEVSPDQLKQAVEDMHGGTATLVESVAVKETFEGKSVWEGAGYCLAFLYIRIRDGRHSNLKRREPGVDRMEPGGRSM